MNTDDRIIRIGHALGRMQQAKAMPALAARNGDIAKQMGFSLQQTPITAHNSFRDASEKKYESSRRYQDEVDRRKAKIDPSNGPEWAWNLTNQQLRQLASEERKSAGALGGRAIEAALGGSIPNSEWELQAAMEKTGFGPGPSEAELERQAEAAWDKKHGIQRGDIKYLADGTLAISQGAGRSLKAKPLPMPKEGMTEEYQRSLDVQKNVLRNRDKEDGFGNDLYRWSLPALREVSWGASDYIIPALAAIKSGQGWDQNAYDHSKEYLKQEIAQLEHDHPYGAIASQLFGGVGPALASGGSSLGGKTALRMMAPASMRGQAVKAGVGGALTADGPLSDRVLTGLDRAATSLALSKAKPYLPRAYQGDLPMAVLNGGADAAVDTLVGRKQEPVVAPVSYRANKIPVKSVTLANGEERIIKDDEEEPHNFLFHAEETPVATAEGPALDNFAQIYPFDKGNNSSSRIMELPSSSLPAMSIVNGKLFLGGDPRDPRNWTAAQSAQ